MRWSCVYATRSTSAIVDIEYCAASSFDHVVVVPSPVPAREVGIVLEDSTSGLELREEPIEILCSTNRVIFGSQYRLTPDCDSHLKPGGCMASPGSRLRCRDLGSAGHSSQGCGEGILLPPPSSNVDCSVAE